MAQNTAEEVKKRMSAQGSEKVDRILYNGQQKTVELFKSNLKGIFVSMYGTFIPSWASGTPVSRGKGIMDALLESISIIDAKGNLIDSIPTTFFRHVQKWYNGKDSPCIFKNNASTLDTYDIGFWNYGVTAQPVAFRESIYIPFECIRAEANFFDTILNYNGRDLNTIKLNFREIAKLQSVDGVVNVSYSHNIYCDVQCVNTADMGGGRRWRRYFKEESFTNATTKRIELDSVDNLMNLLISVGTGNARTPVTMEQARFIKFTLEVKKGGVRSQLHNESTLADLIYGDLNKRKQDSINLGVANMTFISGNLLETAEPNMYDEMNLVITFESDLSFASAYYVQVMVDDLE